jgi:hypothetical protein
MADVKIGSKYFTADYGFVFQAFNVTPPVTAKLLIPVSGTSNVIDLTETLSGDAEYGRRQLVIEGQAVNGVANWAYNYSKLMNDVHGKSQKIVLSTDPAFYWIGRVEVYKFNSKYTGADIQVVCDVDPYKYERSSSLETWLSEYNDPLETILRNYLNMAVTTTRTVTIVGRRKRICPIMTCSGAMTVTYLGNSYSLITGANQNPNILLVAGTNTLVFTCSGTKTVSIDYRGAQL